MRSLNVKISNINGFIKNEEVNELLNFYSIVVNHSPG